MPDPIKSRAEYERQKALYSEYVRQKNDFYKKAYGVEEAPAPAPIPAPAERPGLITRALNRAQVSAMQLGADVGEMLSGIPSPGARPVANVPAARAQGAAGAQKLRARAAELEAKVPEAQTLPEYIASGAGYMAPDIAATMLMSPGVSAAAKGLRPTSMLGRLLAPEVTAGAIRRNIPGAIAAAPLVTLPGAISEESTRSATGTLGEMLTGTRPGVGTRIAGDIAIDVLGGAAAEKILINPLARILGRGAKAAPEAAAVEEALTGPVTTPAAPATPLRLGPGATPMGPAGSAEARQVFEAERAAQALRMERQAREGIPVPPILSPSSVRRIPAAEAQAAAAVRPPFAMPAAEAATPEEVAQYMARPLGRSPVEIIETFMAGEERQAAKKQKLERAAKRAGAGPVEDKVDYMVQSADDPTAQQFITMRNKTTRPGYLSPLSPEELVDKKLTLKHNGKVGYVLDPEGDLQNLFNNKGPKGAAKDAVFDAIRSGGKTLDAFDGYLTDLYRQYGFVETGRLRFNDEFAPAGWNFEKDGRPDVVFMAYRGGEPEDIVRARVNNKETWTPAPPPAQYFDDYDAAATANKSAANAFQGTRTVGQDLGASAGAQIDATGKELRPSGSGGAGGTVAQTLPATEQAGEVTKALGGKAFDIGGAFGASLGTQFGREALPKVGLGVAGYELEQNVEDPRLKATGQGLQLLSMASLGYRPSKELIRSGAINVRDALAQSPQGRTALNLISRDLLIDPKIREVVDYAEREMAKYRAKGLDLARQAQKLGPEGDRLVSDLVENENIQSRAGMDDETIKAAMAVAEKAAREITGLGEEKVATGQISPATFERRKSSYLKRIYAAFKGAEATNPVTVRKAGKTFRIEPERVRNENLSLEERNALGEIREASVRLGETFTRGGKNIATARLFNALANIEGVIAPAFKQAMEEAENARLLSEAAYASGDTEMGRAARGAEIESKRRMKGIAQEIASTDKEYVILPDTPKLSFLRGAVVRKDAAEYLMASPSLGDESANWFHRTMRWWKRTHTVYNPGTHGLNTASNVVKAHMAGLPVPLQFMALRRALKDIREYGPATQALAEAGVLSGKTVAGDVNVEGSSNIEDTLRQIAETTRPETRQALTAREITPRSLAGKKVEQVKNKFKNAYRLEDETFRVALYQKYLADGMPSEDAIKKVTREFPSYDTNSPILKGLRDYATPFIMYPVKYLPSLLDSILENPWRWATLMAAWGGLDQKSREKYGAVNERDLRPEQRISKSLGYVLPGVIQTDYFMRPLAEMAGATVKPGEKYTFDMSRLTPISSFSGSPAPGSVIGKILPNVPGSAMLQPSGPVPEIVSRFANIDPFTGRKWMTGGETAGQKARMIAEDVALPFVTPTAISYYVKKMLKETIPSGSRSELLSDIMGLTGVRPQLVRPGQQARYEQQDFQEQIRAVKSKRDALLRKTELPERRKELMQEAAADLQRIRNKYYAKKLELRGGKKE